MLRFIEHGLTLGTPTNRYTRLVPASSHRHGTQFPSVIDIDQYSCAHIDVRSGDAPDITGVVPRKIATDLDYAILASETVCARTDTNIAFAIYVIACRVADGCVVAASIRVKRQDAHRGVVGSGNIARKRAITKGVIGFSTLVRGKRGAADGVVIISRHVTVKGSGSERI